MNHPQVPSPDAKSFKYPAMPWYANSLEGVDIDILAAGDVGGTWTISVLGQSRHYVVQDGDSVADVATGLRVACDTVPGVTVGGTTSHVTLDRTAALTTFAAPCLFDWIRRPEGGLSETSVTDTEVVAGRGEVRILQSATDVTPLDLPEGPAPVLLGGAEAFAILTKAGISSAGTEAVTGDMGVSPAAASSITGFALTLDGGGAFSTSAEVTGQVFASDYAAPTPATLTAAVSAMEAAYTDAAGRAPDTTELNGGVIGGLTLLPGVYKWTTGVTIASDLTLLGDASDTWILIISGTLSLSAATDIVLSGGALPENVVWAVAGASSLLSTSDFQGILLSQTSVALGVGATMDGRLLAQTAVTLAGGTVVNEP